METSYVKLCKKNDPEFDQCVINSVESLRPRLNKGIPKLQVPPIDPFVLPALEVNRDREAIKVRALLQNIVAYGGSGFIINKLKTDLDNLGIEVSVTLPRIEATADYDVDGRILVAPFKGKGVFMGNFTDVKVDVKGSGKTIKKNGEEYIQVKTIKTKIRVGDSSVKINVKDDRSGVLTQSALQFYKQNKKQVLEIVMPIVQETAEEVIAQISNTVLNTIPKDELLPA
ncbi:hypothetical protein ANN_09904 [Periplaneta americana]|uniref:Circadian clock-controlled protein n=1 Tax=Periplaneta americana TaxID=6978 RepID=A0ABQ8TMQ3_PERAM|nr:hypothetical protein ANN_09904 [Periplaneta americana]